MRKVLSIIIPSYNAEGFLDNILSEICLIDSLDKLEVLVINDGSNDNTSIVAEKYTKKAPNAIRLISKKNGGHGSAINCGIENATGRYFKVVDADDWLDSGNLDKFIKVLETEISDLVLTPFWTVDAKTGRKKLQNIKKSRLDWNSEYLLQDDLLSELPPMHAYTLKTSILKNNNIHLDEHMFYVDVEYIVFPIPFIKKYKFINLPLYNYRVNEKEQSVGIKSMKKNAGQHEFVIFSINRYIKNNAMLLTNPQRHLMIDRLSRMVAAQFKILCLFKISYKTLNNLNVFYARVKKEIPVNFGAMNLPIRLMIKSRFYLFPAIHFLAILKMKIVHVNV